MGVPTKLGGGSKERGTTHLMTEHCSETNLKALQFVLDRLKGVGAEVKNEDFYDNFQFSYDEMPPFLNRYQALNDYLETRAPELELKASDLLNSKEV